MTRIRGLYAISNGPRPDLIEVVAAALDGGARVLQYRDKTTDAQRRNTEARALAALCARHGVPFIVNDDIELAAAVGGGVHLGATDSDVAAARARLGRAAIVGVSCYASLERARQMAAAGADYVAFGAFFASPTKPQAPPASPDLLRAAQSIGLPVVAIGGITKDNARGLIDAGANAVAVISALFDAADVRAAAQELAALFAPERH